MDAGGDTAARALAPGVVDVIELRPPREWQAVAHCRGMDPTLWFPANGSSSAEGKAICATCPVTADCLAFALAHHERLGVWGGLTYRERCALQAAQRITWSLCQWCGAAMLLERYGPAGNQQYCSREHRQAARAERLAARTREAEPWAEAI